MIRKLIAVVIGLAVAMVLVSLIQKIGHSLYPPPADLDPADQEFMREYVASLPWGPLAFVLGSYIIGTFAGGWVAASISRDRVLLIAGIVGFFVLVGVISTTVAIPHPTWFTVTTAIGILIAVLIAAKYALGNRIRSSIL